MTEKEIKQIDKIIGKGVVFDGENELSKVEYSLDIFQEFIIMRSNEGVTKTPSYKQIRGFLQVIDGERNLIGGEILILQLDDGRKLDFFAKSGNPVTMSYEIVVSGGFKKSNEE
jgi:hypothetical protein